MRTKSRAKTTIDAPGSVPALKRSPTHSGEMLLEEVLTPAVTQAEAARQMGIAINRFNEIVRGKRGVTADTALRLARASWAPRLSCGWASRTTGPSGTPLKPCGRQAESAVPR